MPSDFEWLYERVRGLGRSYDGLGFNETLLSQYSTRGRSAVPPIWSDAETTPTFPLRGSYPVDPSVEDVVLCPRPCIVCYPDDPTPDPFHSLMPPAPATRGNRSESRSRPTVSSSRSWFNKYYATSGEPLPGPSRSEIDYPSWWDYLWHHKNQSIHVVMSDLERRIAREHGKKQEESA